jgi:hypothetical protein
LQLGPQKAHDPWPVLDLNLVHQIKDESQHLQRRRASCRALNPSILLKQQEKDAQYITCDPRSHLEDVSFPTDYTPHDHSLKPFTPLRFLTRVFRNSVTKTMVGKSGDKDTAAIGTTNVLSNQIFNQAEKVNQEQPHIG